MKFDKLFLLKLSPDEIIHASAEAYRDWYQVPEGRRWSNQDEAGWGKLLDDCVRKADEVPTKRDKLMVIAHGAKGFVGEGPCMKGTDDPAGDFKLDPDDLARGFKRWGIEKIGLVSFKCCSIGAGSFLASFVRGAELHGLEIGWVKGYTASVRTLRKFPVVGKPYELVNKPDTLFGCDEILGWNVHTPIFGDERVRILRGNQPTTVAESRYMLDADDL
jgi:hypothetical protein